MRRHIMKINLIHGGIFSWHVRIDKLRCHCDNNWLLEPMFLELEVRIVKVKLKMIVTKIYWDVCCLDCHAEMNGYSFIQHPFLPGNIRENGRASETYIKCRKNLWPRPGIDVHEATRENPGGGDDKPLSWLSWLSDYLIIWRWRR